MKSTDLANALRRRRERFQLSQSSVAEQLGISREMISYWETGARKPSAAQVRHLARIFKTTPDQLRRDRAEDLSSPLHVLGESIQDKDLRSALERWSAFLDRWARFLGDDLGCDVAGLSAPPVGLAQPSMVVDRRRAPTFAVKVRDHWNLGHVDLPDLYALFDLQGILVLKADLGPLGVGRNGVVGAFFNHAELGFSMLVNVNATRARQSFTLAHLLAHALFHYSEVAVLCRENSDASVERFSDRFAGNFMVPGSELRNRSKELLQRECRENLKIADGVRLANLFGVSFPTVVMSLYSVGCIDSDQYSRWSDLDAHALASRLGTTTPNRAERTPPLHAIDSFPPSVLQTIQCAITDGSIPMGVAEYVLGIDAQEIEHTLLSSTPKSGSAERAEYSELEHSVRERRWHRPRGL